MGVPRWTPQCHGGSGHGPWPRFWASLVARPIHGRKWRSAPRSRTDPSNPRIHGRSVELWWQPHIAPAGHLSSRGRADGNPAPCRAHAPRAAPPVACSAPCRADARRDRRRWRRRRCRRGLRSPLWAYHVPSLAPPPRRWASRPLSLASPFAFATFARRTRPLGYKIAGGLSELPPARPSHQHLPKKWAPPAEMEPRWTATPRSPWRPLKAPPPRRL